jgi:hypothetical protein
MHGLASKALHTGYPSASTAPVVLVVLTTSRALHTAYIPASTAPVVLVGLTVEAS